MGRTSGVSVYVDNKAEDIPRFISLTMKVEQSTGASPPSAPILVLTQVGEPSASGA